MRSLIALLLIAVLIIGGFIAFNGRRAGDVQEADAVGSLTESDELTSANVARPEAEADSIVGAASANGVFDGRTVLTDEEYAEHKVTYYCELARTTRENCEAVWRGAEAHEQCLRLNQYYTYSRHCGEQP